MTWVKLDDRITEHPKVIETGPFGLALFVASIAYCNRNLTDGFVPRSAMATMLPTQWVDLDDVIWTAAAHSGHRGEDFDCLAFAEVLVDAALFDKAPAGFWIHDYLDYQPSKDEVLALREVRADAGRRGGLAKAKARPKQAASKGSSKEPSKPEANLKPVPVPVPDPENQRPLDRKTREEEAKAALSHLEAVPQFGAL